MDYGYSGRSNPFDDREALAPGDYGGPARGPPQATFGQGPRPGDSSASRYNQAPAYGPNEYDSASNLEMEPLTQNAGLFGSNDPNAILNECRSIDQGIDQVDQNLTQLRMLQDRSLNEADTSGSATTRQLDSLAAGTMALYRQLTERVRQVKSQREAQQPKNAPQIGRVDRRLKQAIQSYQQVESSFRKRTQDQMARQYRIVRPDAPESEIRAVVEDTSGGQVFQQAMMQSDRRGQSRAVLSAVQDRHTELQKIEQQMIELAQLFQDLDVLVIQQDAQVTQIEQKAEEAEVHLDKGNEQIAVAVTTAKSTRKKKWICLGICVAIILIIVIIVVVYVVVNRQSSGGKKRSIEVRGLDFAGEPPVAQIYGQSKIVVRDASREFSSRILIRNRNAATLPSSGDKRSLPPIFPGGVFHDNPVSTKLAKLSKRYVLNTDFTGESPES